MIQRLVSELTKSEPNVSSEKHKYALTAHQTQILVYAKEFHEWHGHLQNTNTCILPEGTPT
jgi:hypothetical protein